MDRYFHLNGTQIRQSHMIGQFLRRLLHENYCTGHCSLQAANRNHGKEGSDQ